MFILKIIYTRDPANSYRMSLNCSMVHKVVFSIRPRTKKMVCINRHPCSFEWNKLNVNIDASAYVDATQKVQQGDLLYAYVSFDIECLQIAKKPLRKKMCSVSCIRNSNQDTFLLNHLLTQRICIVSLQSLINWLVILFNLSTTKYSFKRIEIKTKSPLTWRKSISTARKTHQNWLLDQLNYYQEWQHAINRIFFRNSAFWYANIMLEQNLIMSIQSHEKLQWGVVCKQTGVCIAIERD